MGGEIARYFSAEALQAAVATLASHFTDSRYSLLRPWKPENLAEQLPVFNGTGKGCALFVESACGRTHLTKFLAQVKVIQLGLVACSECF